MTKTEKEEFLLAHGWKRCSGTAWCWHDPMTKGAWYRLEDAWELERARKPRKK